MGEAKRRRAAGERPPDIKIAPRKLAQPVAFVHQNRIERQDERGNTYAVHVYRVVDPATGRAYVEDETPDGPMPVLLQSVPIMIKRAPKIYTGPKMVTS